MNRKLTVYQYPSCDTCRKAVKWLKEQGHELELRHIAEAPPTVEELAPMIEGGGLPIGKWFNVAGEVYRELGLKDKMASLSDAEKMALLSAHGMLIKRPVVWDGVKATVGFRDDMTETWRRR